MGRFIRAAKTHAFFDNTLFVLLGDHGARVYGSAAIPLQSYEVPVLFYAPGRVLAGARVSTVASTLDLPPTILGFLGIAADSVWFGHDAFRTDSTRGRALMTHNSDLALLRDGHMAVLGLHGATTVYAVDSADHIARITNPDSADRELVEDAIAYFYGADQMYRKGALKFDSARARGSAVVNLEHQLPASQVKRPPGLGQ
jgi:arylsulfatase A-like enzyme